MTPSNPVPPSKPVTPSKPAKHRSPVELVDEDSLELSEGDLSWPDDLPPVGLSTPIEELPDERAGEPGSSFPEPAESPLSEQGWADQDWAERTADTDIDAFDDDGLLESEPGTPLPGQA